ncbi:MAG: IS66 family transposase [Spirochaetota bacterium]
MDKNKLPNDPKKLKQIIFDLALKNKEYEEELKEERRKYLTIYEQFNTLRRLYFGKRSEKLTPDDREQMRLFNEAEAGAEETDQNYEVIHEENLSTVKSYTRKRPGRKPLSPDLPREEVVYDLSEEEKQCPCCQKERPVISKEETEELDIIPAKIKVIKHIRIKYGPCECDEFLHKGIPEVKIALMPERMIPGSIASPGLLAYVLTSKYVDSLPFYRQSKMFERINADISRATMCNWAILTADRCKELISIMAEEIRSGPLIQMDETTVQVLKEPERKAESKSYMWVSVGYPTGEKSKPLILYNYHPTRSEIVPKEFLKGYKGYLQTDGYAGYNNAGAIEGIVHAGCFAHARRYFYEAMKQNKKSKAAHKGLSYIQKIYSIESDLRERKLENDEFIRKRKDAVLPILEEFKNWLLSQNEIVLPESKTGKAIKYAISEWDKLTKYLLHHLMTPDNNMVENVIRPFVIGRKNWLFSNTPRGANASAVIYSLIESAKANGLEPYNYLRFLFNNLPKAKSREDIRKLVPSHLSPENIFLP